VDYSPEDWESLGVMVASGSYSSGLAGVTLTGDSSYPGFDLDPSRPWFLVATYAQGVSYLIVRRRDSTGPNLTGYLAPEAAGLNVAMGSEWDGHLGLEIKSTDTAVDTFLLFVRRRASGGRPGSIPSKEC